MNEEIKNEIRQVITEQFMFLMNNNQTQQEWLDLKSGAKYAKVSYNTFIKYRKKGLRICEIDGVKRVQKSEIDRFLQEHSF